MAATLSVGGFVHRSCGQHGSYAVRAGAPAGCPSCRENARKRGYEAARRAAAGLSGVLAATSLMPPTEVMSITITPRERREQLSSGVAKNSDTTTDERRKGASDA